MLIVLLVVVVAALVGADEDARCAERMMCHHMRVDAIAKARSTPTNAAETDKEGA